MSRRFPRTATALAVLTVGALTGWNAPLSVARQSPDAWSGEHRAVLPSRLTVQLDFTAAPGTGVSAEPGRLADRSGRGRSAPVYADGKRPGDAAQAFRITPDRPQADGSWHTAGTLRLDFSQPVRNPRLHLSGLAAVAAGKPGTTSTAARLVLTGGSPAAPALTRRTDWPGWTVDAGSLAPRGSDGSSDGAPGSAAEGTLELTGTVHTAVFRVEQRSTARDGSTTAPPVLRQAFTVTVDEDLGTAPRSYGNASHVVSDLFLGTGAITPARRDRPRPGGSADGGPVIEPDHGAVRRGNPFTSPAGSPPPSGLQPGRGEYQGADPSIGFPDRAAIGHYYRLTVPVAVGGRPATLAGWIDFDHNGRFEPADRVQTEIPAGADTATLEWTVPPGAVSGETWARLRIGRDTVQLVPSGGFADSGQVSDQRIRLTVGAARPEIAEPVDGTVLADARPRIRGEGAVPGASVEVREGDATLCRAGVELGGDWSCRPADALAAGANRLAPVETTSGGVVLRGEAVGVAVKTTPPTAPALTLPAYTNDPGLRLTGTGEAGSIVSVTDRATSSDLCSGSVRPDGAWSCLPVENLADGSHRLTPVAVDAAGNRAAGQPVALVVDTVPPDRPVLGSPAAGEVLRVSRPKLAGRAEPAANVLVTAASSAGAGSGPGSRTVLCGVTSALDGSWSCTANRDLPDGEQWLTVTATDRAGNGGSADPVRVRVAAAAPTPAAADPSAPVPASPGSVAPSPSTAASTAAVGAGATQSGGTTPVASSPKPAGPTAAPEVPPVPPGLLPVVVPPVRPLVPETPAGGTTTGSIAPTGSAPAPRGAVPSTGASSDAGSSGAAPAPQDGRPGRAVEPSAVVAAGLPSAATAADQGGSGADRATAPPVPAPPVEGVAAGRPREARWHGLLAGVLLVLAGIGLITRRVFARGSGARRR
ncbi:Ig-like domain-containing protein [Kitasatospora sp. NPDC059648]|uniref:Ig-like domain-containing protein n=1 Tax=Kitasatospora sp. NPDC059648 TaxID=3346894 RepID=UPI0036B28BE0